MKYVRPAAFAASALAVSAGPALAEAHVTMEEAAITEAAEQAGSLPGDVIVQLILLALIMVAMSASGPAPVPVEIGPT